MVGIEKLKTDDYPVKEEFQEESSVNPLFRNKMVEAYLPLVKSIAAKLCSATPANIEYDDLVSTGLLGLISAIENFDPNRNVKFSTYSRRRIKGAMLDELRKLDWVPRHTRRRINRFKLAEAELEAKLNRKPKTKELAVELQLDTDKLQKLQKDCEPTAVVSLECVTRQNDGEQGHDYRADEGVSDPSEAIESEDLRKFITRELGRKERLIIVLYYYEQLTMRQIGALLRLSESRLSQIHSVILKDLKNYILANEENLALTT